jgi:hypothetical protein
MSQAISQLFTEIFRPKTIEQAILVPRVREELSKGLTQNILLQGEYLVIIYQCVPSYLH